MDYANAKEIASWINGIVNMSYLFVFKGWQTPY